jgi:predicted molibdopterin-dependent oxidoreductase YjgC
MDRGRRVDATGEQARLRMTSDVARDRQVRIVVDGEDVDAYEGESLAAALLASGRRLTRWMARTGEPRGYYCGMGVCHDCLLTVDGTPNVRSCMTTVRDGLRVETQHGLGEWRIDT